MDGLPEPMRLPEPEWLAGRSTPLIDALLQDLGDDARRRYRRYLADEVRAMGPHSGGAAAWRAFDRVLYEILRHREPRVP
jgi:hypothetical protein